MVYHAVMIQNIPEIVILPTLLIPLLFALYF